MKTMIIGAGLLAAIGCRGGTASVTPRTANSAAETAAAIAAAETVVTQDQPQASLYLKLAKDQLQEAQQLINKEETDKAQLFLERATADAELALMLARESDAKEKAQRAQQQLQALPDSPERSQ